jgi:hypothetical protein
VAVVTIVKATNRHATAKIVAKLRISRPCLVSAQARLWQSLAPSATKAILLLLTQPDARTAVDTRRLKF